ncbi:hypothetical protein CPAR01_02034 [Colletotrichum paranaense]|uniref:Uncharacterized protein n=1 Tax=Colletotrichum paranaense TaxID=1914294 RepID=A0ABQ9SYD2_9PEZI|nr:uncharacterized protein CPAR01_02034 [Colletotrichum paranaense]KAK1544532.1 hypothetical protein CPAR01_02034 [Colletotrichum paranaense]
MAVSFSLSPSLPHHSCSNSSSQLLHPSRNGYKQVFFTLATPPPLLRYPTRIPGYLRSPYFYASQPEENRMPAYPHPTLPGPDLPPPISPIEWPGTTAVEGGWITKSSLNTPPRPSFDWPTLLNLPNFPSRPPRTSPDQARPDKGTVSLHVRHFFLSSGILYISHLDLDLDFDTLNSPQPLDISPRLYFSLRRTRSGSSSKRTNISLLPGTHPLGGAGKISISNNKIDVAAASASTPVARFRFAPTPHPPSDHHPHPHSQHVWPANDSTPVRFKIQRREPEQRHH